jgi:hypothetical protein
MYFGFYGIEVLLHQALPSISVHPDRISVGNVLAVHHFLMGG